MSSHVLVSVIVPAYNESERLGPTLQSIGAYFDAVWHDYEVIVVDDGSRDGTAEFVRNLTRNNPHMKILRHERNVGKGWAVRSGMLNARGRYRLFMDADGSTSITHWPLMRDELDRGADVIVGSRHVEGSEITVHQSAHRESLGAVFRFLVQSAFRLPVVDTQNGFKAFTASAAERIFRRQKVPGWAFDVEILSIARSLGYRIREVPVRWVDDNRSKMTFAAMPRMLMELARIKVGARVPQERFLAQEIPRWV